MDKPLLLRSNYLYVFGLCVLVTGMPLSLFLTSLSQFILAGSFLIEGNPLQKFRRFLRSRPALIICGIFLMHLIGMLWTSNAAEGWKDIRIKLPLLMITMILCGSDPLSGKQFRLVLGFFIAAVFTGTLVSAAVMTGLIQREYYDIRDVFIFSISHIRFALFTCVAFFALGWFAFREPGLKRSMRMLFLILAGWLMIFLVLTESLTGISAAIVVMMLLLTYRATQTKNMALKILLLAPVVLIPLIMFYAIFSVHRQYFPVRNELIDLDAKTARGNPYEFDLNNAATENGYLIYTYVCDDELRQAWNERSPVSYDSLDKKNQLIRFTLIRFLASKGFRKDYEAVSQLTDSEVRSIEKGISNVHFQGISNIKTRLVQVVWEYDRFMHGGDPSGHSVMQRLEFWRAAIHIIKAHPVIGVGTGDMPAAYSDAYRAMESKLGTKYYLRAHNQYLAIAVAFGLTGLAYFLFALFYPLFAMRKHHDYFYAVFLVIAILSMITEDTLETQAGATFFAFFNAFFLFAKPER